MTVPSGNHGTCLWTSVMFHGVEEFFVSPDSSHRTFCCEIKSSHPLSAETWPNQIFFTTVSVPEGMENAFSIHHSRLRHRADPSPDATCAAGSGVWGLEPVSIIINHISIYLFVNLTLCQSINQSINQSTNNLSIH